MEEERREEMVPEEKEEGIKKEEVIGEITFSPDIIATLAAITVMKVPGVTSLGGLPAAPLSTLVGRKDINKGVKVELKDKTVNLEISLVVNIDSSLIEVAKEVQRKVKRVVEDKTGMTVNKVDIIVRDVSYPEKEKEEEEKEEDVVS
ncbi:MAG TPA: Asp23/Gls24 family envelope stress response protein [Candidatus Atribacteria bacterium]|nr:Asp23/Gls24 family envelope stress response protein [Candidatus Atribacteria bacterium]HPU08625.1 Asp23/Gls24 family envelope stress response protein [Candidatus Atribacteria bacterium]HQE26088.1 Asp23/Gls24 family envelope stress response protein [Candidatus Atribacteria bacterium]